MRIGEQTTLFLKKLGFLASVPQATKKHLAKQTLRDPFDKPPRPPASFWGAPAPKGLGGGSPPPRVDKCLGPALGLGGSCALGCLLQQVDPQADELSPAVLDVEVHHWARRIV